MKPVFLSLLLIASLHGASSAEEYQAHVSRVRESLYGRAGDDLAEPPKLDEATRQRLTGELLELDPYWRLEQQLIDDLRALGEHSDGDQALEARTAAYRDILSLVRSHFFFQGIPPTKKQAEGEVAQLRICLFRADVAAAEKLFRAWNK
jgi:hypothetical protein